jgi:hypothetical protein
VATYEYRCERDGVQESTWPAGTAPQSVTCAVCGGEARRVFSTPMLPFSSRLPRELAATMERTEKSRTEPEVVTSLPARGQRSRTPMAPLTPALRRLPRP